MKKWVKINSNWKLRLTIEGVEFVSYDENISLDLSSVKKNIHEEFLTILRGKKNINIDNKSELLDVLIELKNKNIISFTNESIVFSEWSKTEMLLQKIRKEVVGEKGIIKRVYLLNPERSKFKSGKSILFSTKYISKTGYRNKKMIEWTSGISMDPIVSELKAVMEGIERFYSGEVDLKKVKKMKGRTSRVFIDPANIVAYEKKQYRSDISLEEYSQNKKYFWKEGKFILTGRKVLVPIDLIYYPIDKGLTPHLLTFGNSNGIAAGFSYKDTLERSLYEVIERDAFMIVWINRLICNQFFIESLPLYIRKRIKKIEETGLRVHVVDVTMDTAPVVLILAVGTILKPVILIGASAGSDMIACVDKALSEVEQGVYWEYRDDSKIIKVTDPKKVLKVKEHVSLYRNAKFFKEADFLWKGKYVDLNNKKCKKNIVSILSENNNEIVVVDMSPYRLKKNGVIILRSYILGFVPLSFGYGLESLGMNRIKQLPKKMRMKVNPWKSIPLPHPFP